MIIDDLAERLVGVIFRAIEPLEQRLAVIEEAFEKAMPPKDGADGADGKDADPKEVAEIVTAELKEHIDSLKADLASMSDAIPEAVDPDAIAQDVLKMIPTPKDGQDGKDGRHGEKGDVGEVGVGLAGAMIDQDGGLVVTLSSGEIVKLGTVVGKDGSAGANGADGLGFDDLTFEQDEEGRPTAVFRKGELEKRVGLPCLIDRGPFRKGEQYQKGDAVSYGGSLWIAQGSTEQRPDGGAGWRLAVKKGRDGRDQKVVI